MTKDTKADLVRVATWIEADIMRQIKLRAAIDGRTIRSLIEESFTDWVKAHPVDRKALRSAVK